MPRDGSGVYTLPAGTIVTSGQTIQPSQHNPAFEDVGSALTGSLPRNGSAPMTAPLKASDGSAADPAFAFNSLAGIGIYKTMTPGIGFSVGGAQVAELTATGFVGATPVGAGVDYWGTAAPAGWLFPYGQAVSRTTYAALFTILGTTYGVGDGSTTFNLPDKRGRASFGKDDMGSVSANRLTGLSGGINGDILGAVGGEQAHALTSGENASHTHSGTTDGQSNVHAHTVNDQASYSPVASGGLTNAVTSLAAGATGTNNVDHSHTFTTSSSGSGAAHNTLPPGIVCNYIIFAGA